MFAVAARRREPRGTRRWIAGSRPRTSSADECQHAGNIRGGRSAERRGISGTRNLSVVHTNRDKRGGEASDERPSRLKATVGTESAFAPQLNNCE